MGTEYRIFGPPGSGKTTYLASEIAHAAERRGAETIIVASFTKAAAVEIAGRGLPLFKSQVGTLHAHCYRLLGNPEIAETHLDEWNKDEAAFALSDEGKQSLDDTIEQSFKTDADALMAMAQSLRARMVPHERWPTAVVAFHNRWTAWKQEHSYIDFTDMIEFCASPYQLPTAPGNPEIAFFDEVQDFTALELSVIRKWARSMDMVVLAGDDDQSIYSFKGATPDAFLNPPVPDAQKRFLRQSYRLPRAVQSFCMKWISQVEKREEKQFNPRDAEGAVRRLHGATWRNPEALLADAQQYLDAGKSVMFLTSCAYMLENLKAYLRALALPFHNPYRVKRGDWNPIGPRKGTGAKDRILAYLKGDYTVWGDDCGQWSSADIAAWTDPLAAEGVFKRGGKKALAALPIDKDTPDVFAHMLPYIEDDALAHAFDGDLSWYKQHLLPASARSMDYALRIADRHGAAALRRVPQIIIGTIHSVKGGEAEIVYVCPDLSLAGMNQWLATRAERDAIVRQFYVACSRAKETLVLVGSASSYTTSLEGFR